MATVLKAGQAPVGRVAPAVFQMRDLLGEAHVVIAEAREQAERIMAEARSRAEALRESESRRGFEAGLEQGLTEGRQRGDEKAFQAAQERYTADFGDLGRSLGAAIEQVNNQRVECLQAAERDLLDFAVGLARRVAHYAGELRPEVVQQNLQAVLELVMANSDVTVRVHPEDLACLRRFAAELAERLEHLPHVTFVEDGDISRGGVLVRTAGGEVDARLEVQMDQIAQALLTDERE